MGFRPSPASFVDPRLSHYTSSAPYHGPPAPSRDYAGEGAAWYARIGVWSFPPPLPTPAQSRDYDEEDAAVYNRLGIWPFPPPLPDLEGVAAGTMRPPPGLERPIDSRHPGLQHPPRLDSMVGPTLAEMNPPPGLEVHILARQFGLRPPPGLESGTTLNGVGGTQLPTADGMSARPGGGQRGFGLVRDNGHLVWTAHPTADGPLYAPRARLPKPSHADRFHRMCAAAEEARERSAMRKPDSEEDRRLWKTGLRDLGNGTMIVMDRVTGEERRKRQRAARLRAEAAETEEWLETFALLESLEEQDDTAERG
ncbi:hypothetical protein IMZ48_39010 [Candidatus Bathyarchaeota archaeon]|nr:hypothetical protein [Candidatus Bathyarchaeota archaeon]